MLEKMRLIPLVTLLMSSASATTIISTQSEANSALKQSLDNGVPYVDGAFSNQIITQINPQENIAVLGFPEKTLSLQLNLSPDSTQTIQSANNLQVTQHTFTLGNLKQLSFDLSAQGSPTQFSSGDYANVFASGKNAHVIVKNDVQSLLLNNQASANIKISATENMLAMDGAKVSIFSPTVTLENTVTQNGHQVLAKGDDTVINFGSKELPISSLTLHSTRTTKNSQAHGISLLNGSTNQINVFTHRLSIDNTIDGIHAEGGYVTLGAADKPIEYFVQTKTQKGLYVQSSSNQQNDNELNGSKQGSENVSIWAKRHEISFTDEDNTLQLSIMPTSGRFTPNGIGFMVINGGRVKASYGSGADEGLRILGTKKFNKESFGILLSLHTGYSSEKYKENDLTISQGNVNIDNTTIGILNDIPFRFYEKGYRSTALFDVESMTISNTTTSIRNHDGDTLIHAKHFHGEGEILNYGGEVHINDGPNDKGSVTFIRGNITTNKLLSFRDTATWVTFSGPQSQFIGSAVDSELNLPNSTTLTFLQGATWFGVRPEKNDKWVGESIAHLNLDGGNVVIGAEGSFYDPNNYNGKADERDWWYTSTSNYNVIRVKELNDATMGTKGGTFEFRTNFLALPAIRYYKNKKGYNWALNISGHSDQLIITNSSYGRHIVKVNDTSGKRVPSWMDQLSESDYLLIIQDQSDNHEAEFVLDKQSIYDGHLFPIGIELIDTPPPEKYGYHGVPKTGRNWYLHLRPWNESPMIPLEPATPTAQNNMHFNDARYALFFFDEDTLRKRLGTPSFVEDKRRVWARARAGEYKLSAVQTKGAYRQIQMGLEKHVGDDNQDNRCIGLGYSFERLNLNYAPFPTQSHLNAHKLTLAYTSFKDNRYLDLVAKVGRITAHMQYTGPFEEKAKWRAWQYGLSLETGWRFKNSRQYYVEPQMQLSYNYLTKSHYVSTNNIEAKLNSFSSLRLRAGAELGREFERGQLYLHGFVYHEFLGNVGAEFYDQRNYLQGIHRFNRTSYTLGLGGERTITSRTKLYGQINRNWKSMISSPWEVNIGLRYAF